MKHEIDAANQSLGRVASQIAEILRGKHLPSFRPDVLPQIDVIVRNTNKIKFTGQKLKQKVYHHYSGYHSGLKTTKLSELWLKNPENVLRMSVYRMLPKNKTRDKIIKNLKFK